MNLMAEGGSFRNKDRGGQETKGCRELLGDILSPSDEFTPVPFWFFNDRPEKEKIEAQLADFVQKGVCAFVLHPRIGIPEEIPYLSEAFFETVGFIVRTAANLNMKVVLYDEGMYPSGSAHGMVVAQDPDFAARGLTLRTEWDKGAKARIFGGESGGHSGLRQGERVIARLADGRYLAEDFTGGTIRGIHFGEDDGQKRAPLAADILNPLAVSCFIRLTHEKYYEKLGEYFGRTVIGFFTDEPDPLGRGTKGFHIWAQGMEQEIVREGGCLEELAGLFDGEENKTTGIYRRLVKKHLRKTYYQPLADWCGKHGIALMGHPAQSDDVSELFLFDVPGQDLIQRRILPKEGGIREADSVHARLCADVARHLGKRRSLNECFGVCGRREAPWHFTGEDMKWYIDWLAMRGVNLFVPHAFYYSVEGARSGERPPDVGPHNIWWKHYRCFSDYMKRLSFLMTDTCQHVKAAVLCDDNNVPGAELAALYENQIGFHYLPLALLDRCEIRDGRLRIGQSSYEVVLDLIGAAGTGEALAGVETVYETRELVKRASRLCTLRTVLPSPFLRVCHFTKNGVECCLLSNEGGKRIEAQLLIPGAREDQVVCVDLWRGTFWREIPQQMSDAGGPVWPVSLDVCETRLLLLDPRGEIPARNRIERRLGDWTKRFRLVYKLQNQAIYEYDYDCASAAEDGDGCFTVCGEEMAECWCNDQFAGAGFWGEHRFSIGPYLKEGKNRIRLVFTGSAANIYDRAGVAFGLSEPKKLYFDRTVNSGCTGIFVKGAEVIPAGTTLCVMSARDDGPEYRRFAEEYDIRFLFEGCPVPPINFYAVPQVDIFAADSAGGLFGTVGGITDLEGDAPICYVDRAGSCSYLAPDGRSFLASLSDWKKNMVPAADILLFASRKEAVREKEFVCSYDSVLNQIEDAYRRILEDALTGIYVHGSIAFGCFCWENSDIDFIVVINKEITHGQKRELIQTLLDLDAQAPQKGLEMSVVLEKYCNPFVYPTPFELHFSNAHRERCRKDLEEYCRTMHGEDKDLAAHFTVIRKVGITLCGKEIFAVFGEVPKEAYLDSIKGDVENAQSDILDDPVYIILNVCRVIAFIEEGLVLSKEQGGKWGMRNLPETYRPMIGKALQSYRGNGVFREEEENLRSFGESLFRYLFPN